LVRTGRAWRTSKVTGGPSVVAYDAAHVALAEALDAPL
jgi:predicted nucleic acid-binding protein